MAIDAQQTSDRKPSRIVFINRFFYPDHSATAQILYDIAEATAANGRSVDVITSRLSYDAKQVYPAREKTGEIRIRRVMTSRFGRSSVIGRALDYASFYVSASFTALVMLRHQDIVVVKTDPPLLSVPIGLIARLRGARLINWLQDIYPDVAIELGVVSGSGGTSKLLRWLRNRSFARADMNVVIGQRMADVLARNGVSSRNITIIENFSDDQTIAPSQTRSLSLRRKWGIGSDDFVVGYSGNLGRAHDYATLLNAAEHLRSSHRVKFLFVGGGHRHDQLRSEIGTRNLTNVVFRPYQPRCELSDSLNLPDLHWVSLRPELEGLIVPSKFYGIVAAGRPVLFIGDPDGEIGRITQANGLGVTIKVGDSTELANVIRRCSNDPGSVVRMGRAARWYVDAKHSKALAINRWSDLLAQVEWLNRN